MKANTIKKFKYRSSETDAVIYIFARNIFSAKRVMTALVKNVSLWDFDSSVEKDVKNKPYYTKANL